MRAGDVKSGSKLRRDIQSAAHNRALVCKSLKISSDEMSIIYFNVGCWFIEQYFCNDEAEQRRQLTESRYGYWMWYSLVFSQCIALLRPYLEDDDSGEPLKEARTRFKCYVLGYFSQSEVNDSYGHHYERFANEPLRTFFRTS